MTILSLIIGTSCRLEGDIILLHTSFYLEDVWFFHKKSIEEACIFATKFVLSRAKEEEQAAVQYRNYSVYYRTTKGLGAVFVSDEEYPLKVAKRVLLGCLNEFLIKTDGDWMFCKADNMYNIESIYKLLEYCQVPENIDKIYKVQKQLEETKEILYRTLDSLLCRGEKIEDLVKKSDDLSEQSKLFYKESKKMNKCCVIL